MDNYKKYLFDGQEKIFSFGGSVVGGPLETEIEPSQEFDEEYRKDFLKSQIKSIREKLVVMGFPPVGDLFNPSSAEVQMTVKALLAIIQQRKQDMDFRNSIHDRLAKSENDKNALQSNFDRIASQKKNLEQELSQLQAKLKSQEKASKEQMQKLMTEKDEIQKAYLKIQNMKAQYEHEIKQRDLNLQKLQEHLKKAQGQKIGNFRNAFEITNQLEQSGPNLFAANVIYHNYPKGEFEFSQLVMKRWEEVNKKLQIENETLKDHLTRIHQELNEILTIRKEVYLRRKKIDFGDDYNGNMELERPDQSMIQFNKDLFKTPLENNCKDAILMLQENLAHFREIMKKFDSQYEIQLNEEDFNTEGDAGEIGKIRACKNLSELFKNYNQIFETQDKMINQIIGKSQGLKKLDELNYNINRFNRVLDDKQIDDVRRYLQEQKIYLDESKHEMDMIKKQFQQQLKKREEEKQVLQVKRQQLEETNEKFKENIRLLQNASKQAIQNLLQSDDFTDKRTLQENQMNEAY